MARPLVSVAMATWNGERFLRAQLDSLVAQTYSPIEIVVSDDASTDRTVEILEEYRLRHGIQYQANSERLGFRGNFERALLRCRGDLIAFCDQDDVWLPEKIEVLAGAIGDASLVCSDLSAIDAEGKLLVPSMVRNNSLPMWNPERWRMTLNFKLIAIGCASLFRRELLDEALPIPPWTEGHDWWIAMLAVRRGGIRFVDRVLTLYRRHDRNVSIFENNTSETARVLRYLDPEKLRTWYRTRARQRAILANSLETPLELGPEERAGVEACIRYLDDFLDGRLAASFFATGYRYRDYLYSRPQHFWLEAAAHLVNSARRLVGRPVRWR